MRLAWLIAIGGFLSLLFAVPLFGVLHAAGGALLGGAILLCVIVVQYPLFLLVRRWLPPIERGTDD